MATSFDSAVFPFREPNLRISDWDVEYLSPDNSAELIPSEDFKNKRLADIIDNPSVPIVAFTSQVYQEIMYLVESNAHQECGVFLTMKRLHNSKPHFLAFDWFMPGQKVTSATVSMQAADSEKYYSYLKETYPYYRENGLHRYLCHLHSHGNIALPTFSGTDDNQQFSKDDLGFMDDYRFYIVVTAKGNIKASLVAYKPSLTRVDAAVAKVFYSQEHVDMLTKKRKEEIDAIAKGAIFKEPVPISTYTKYTGTSSYDYSSFWGNYSKPVQELPKELEFSAAPEAVHQTMYIIRRALEKSYGMPNSAICVSPEIRRKFINMLGIKNELNVDVVLRCLMTIANIKKLDEDQTEQIACMVHQMAFYYQHRGVLKLTGFSDDVVEFFGAITYDLIYAMINMDTTKPECFDEVADCLVEYYQQQMEFMEEFEGTEHIEAIVNEEGELHEHV